VCNLKCSEHVWGVWVVFERGSEFDSLRNPIYQHKLQQAPQVDLNLNRSENSVHQAFFLSKLDIMRQTQCSISGKSSVMLNALLSTTVV
jgi:hypothetical protein